MVSMAQEPEDQHLHLHLQWDSVIDNLESGEGVDYVQLDFSKAFDKFETGVLLQKFRDNKVLGKVGC